MLCLMAKNSHFLMRWFEEPETRGLDLDDPRASIVRRRLSKTKRGLYLSYLRWYRQLAELNRAAPAGLRVELGSGGGFLEEFIPDLITTDVLPLPFVQKVCSAEQLPFGDATVGAIFMVNVLHHINDVSRFFTEARRVLVSRGMIAMIEPYVSPFSRFVYTYIHHEPFDEHTDSWQLPPSGPLSGGNDALPWNVFVRDRVIYEARYPNLKIERIAPNTFLSHLLSGGVTMRSFVPPFVIPLCQKIENRMGPLLRYLGVFGTIVLRKTD
jgi:SAM-dependent methyltransferase